MKAMLLAAGRGERMKSLTDAVPKPLLSAGSETLIEHNLRQLKKAGVTEVVINVSYRAKQLIAHVGDGERFGMQITYSYEPDVLGTGGGIFQALQFLGKAPFLVLSSDVWTDYPFEKLFDQPKDEGHLVLVENPYFHPEGDYCLRETGKLAKDGLSKLTYASFGVMHPRLFQHCSSGHFSISTLLEKAMASDGITGELYQGSWYNVGTKKELMKLQQDLCIGAAE